MGITPYLISVEFMLYHGSNLLNENARYETKKIPFQYNPRWYEWVEFKGLLFSYIPAETRLCMNIKVYNH